MYVYMPYIEAIVSMNQMESSKILQIVEQTQCPRRYLYITDTGEYKPLEDLALNKTLTEFLEAKVIMFDDLSPDELAYYWYSTNKQDQNVQDLVRQVHAANVIFNQQNIDGFETRYSNRLDLDLVNGKKIALNVNRIYNSKAELTISRPISQQSYMSSETDADEYEVFDSMVPDDEVPLICLHSIDGQIFFKVYEQLWALGKTKVPVLNRSLIGPAGTVKIYLTRDYSLIFDSKTKSFLWESLDEEHGKSVFDVISTHTDLVLTEPSISSTQKTFMVFGKLSEQDGQPMALGYQKHLLFGNCLTNPSINQFLQLNELAGFFITKNKHTIYYTDRYSRVTLTIVITEQVMNQLDKLRFVDLYNRDISIANVPGLQFWNVQVKADKIGVMETEIEFIAALLQYWIGSSIDDPNLINFANQWDLGKGLQFVQYRPSVSATPVSLPSFTVGLRSPVPQYEDDYDEPESTVSATATVVSSPAFGRGTSKLNLLKSSHPDVFMKGYATACTQEKQPSLISQQDVEIIRNQEFTFKGITHKRQAYGFPINEPKLWFYCPQENFPFPHLVPNKTDNKDIYPSLPCCSNIDQSGMGKSIYRHMMGEAPAVKIRSKQVIQGVGILDFGQFGGLADPPLERLLSLTVGNQPFAARRAGFEINESPNMSCLHALLLSMDDRYATQYMNFSHIAHSELTGQVDLLKTELLSTFPDDEVLKSELSKHFVDPRKINNQLEEFFGVNLYYIEPIEKTSIFTTPSFYHFYASPSVYNPNDETLRPAVILMVYSNPHCELVVFDTNLGRLRRLEGEYQSSIIDWLSRNSSKFIEFKLTVDSLVTIPSEKFDPMRALRFNGNIKISGQFLDGADVGRGLLISGVGGDITIGTGPFKKLYGIPVISNLKRTNISVYEQWKKFFMTPVSRTSADWIKHPQNILIPVETLTPELESLPIIEEFHYMEYIDIDSTTDDKLKTLIQNKRTASILWQMYIILYVLYAVNKQVTINTPGLVDEFIESCMLVDPDIKIDLTSISYRFNPESYDSVINQWKTQVPDIFDNNRILVTSNDMANGVYHRLSNWVREHQFVVANLTDRFEGYYQSVDDFNKQDSTKIFGSWNDYFIWFRQSKTYYMRVMKFLDRTMIHNVSPVLYKQGSDYWIVQPVSNGDLARAINVVYTWKTTKMNLGFIALPYPTGWQLPRYTVHVMNLYGQIEYTDVLRSGVLDILRSDVSTFLAMLRLTV